MRHGLRRRGLRPAHLLALAAVAGCGPGGPVEADIIFRDVTLIDGTDAGARPGMSVAIRGDRIVAVGPAAELTAAPGAAEVDGTGRFLIPGLWDMHVHVAGFGERSFPLFLANGVTAIREMGGDPRLTAWMRQETRFGRLLGPQMFIAGPTLHGGPVARALRGTPLEAAALGVADSAAAVAAIDSLAGIGVDFVKIHASLTREAWAAVMAEADRRGLTVVGHVPDPVMPREAIQAGLRTVEHASRVAFANSPRGEEITAWMVARMRDHLESAGTRPRPGELFRIRLAAEDSATQGHDAAVATAFAEWAADREVWFTPTLVTWRMAVRPDEPALRRHPGGEYLPRAVRQFDDLPPPRPAARPDDLAAGRRRWEAARTALGALVASGARFLAGTDLPVGGLVPGFSLHQELAALVDLGLTPLQALQAATRNAAAAVGMGREAGTVEPGRLADLVLLGADPLADIAATARIEAVVARGRLLDRATLDRMLADAAVFARQP